MLRHQLQSAASLYSHVQAICTSQPLFNQHKYDDIKGIKFLMILKQLYPAVLKISASSVTLSSVLTSYFKADIMLRQVSQLCSTLYFPLLSL
jgi:hypothetical protein